MSDNAKEIIERFGAWIRTRGLSQAQAAKLIGVSPATLSQCLSGTYAGDTERVADKMERAIEADKRRQNAPKPLPFSPTSVVQEMLGTLRIAYDEGAMAVVMGSYGIGKTESCRVFCRAEPETVLITIQTPSRKGIHPPARPVLERIGKAIGSPLALNAGIMDCIEMLGERLAGSGRLIILDDIDYAGEDILQSVRMIHDRARCGIAIVGTTAFIQRLRGRRSATINQFLSRVAYSTMLQSLTDDDVDELLSPFSLDAQALAVARQGCHGCARRLNNAMVTAQRLARDNDGKMDAKTIAQAYKSLMEV